MDSENGLMKKKLTCLSAAGTLECLDMLWPHLRISATNNSYAAFLASSLIEPSRGSNPNSTYITAVEVIVKATVIYTKKAFGVYLLVRLGPPRKSLYWT